ncbi:MAG: molybdopterin-dependent oxidoreductase [Gammaproteobacteria bacterium]|nr:molybdopterin-dependent oxidoreductase [Gammaproteobacteria bacterium]
MTSEIKIISTTCPRDCYDGCGISVITRDGKIATVTGNKEHPSNRGPLCAKCSIAYNGAWRNESARLLHPMRRAGEKGAAEFEKISWQEALDEIATRLTDIQRTTGVEKIAHTHYTGTCSMLAIEYPCRFFEHIGATEIEPDTICNNAGHVAWNYVFGNSLNGFDPRTIRDSKCVLVWGANPSVTAPHVHRNWLYGNDVKVIVVDPVKHETAAKADIHLQVRPGSDAALTYSLLHVIQRDGMLDEDFIKNNVIGYEEVKTWIAESSPDWGATQTGIPADLIEKAAHLYAQGPSIMWLGQGLQRQARGGNVFRACAMLPAFTGNIGKAGTGAYYLNDTFGIARNKGLSNSHVEDDGEDCGHSIGQMDLPDAINDPDQVKAFIVWNSNPAASNPAQEKIARGLSREDLFTVVVDCFLTDTASYADIILPAASFLEFDDLCASYFHLMLGAQVKAMEPPGEALPNQEIFRRLAAAMKLDGGELYEQDEDILRREMEKLDIGLSWEELRAAGWAFASTEPMILWADGKYSTPSGKIEIASAQAQKNGLPLTPTPDVDAPAPGNHLRLLSPADKYLMNSSYGNDPKIRQKLGPATVTINPEDAKLRDIAEGDPVIMSNETGELTLTAKVSDIVPAGTALSAKSRWVMHEPGKVNVNILHTPRKTDMGESTSVHGTKIMLQKV